MLLDGGLDKLSTKGLFIMLKRSTLGRACAVAALGLATQFSSVSAQAEGPEFSANVALTTDYIFRGFSQTDEGAAIQGGMDMTWNIFYVGVWGSNLDFGNAPGNGNFSTLLLF